MRIYEIHKRYKSRNKTRINCCCGWALSLAAKLFQLFCKNGLTYLQDGGIIEIVKG